MARMKILLTVIAISTSIFPNTSYASDLDDARLSLKKWGLAYCLSEHLVGPDVEKDAGGALEAYFQRGAHADEKAYANVRNFFSFSMKGIKNFKKNRTTVDWRS